MNLIEATFNKIIPSRSDYVLCLNGPHCGRFGIIDELTSKEYLTFMPCGHVFKVSDCLDQDITFSFLLAQLVPTRFARVIPGTQETGRVWTIFNERFTLDKSYDFYEWFCSIDDYLSYKSKCDKWYQNKENEYSSLIAKACGESDYQLKRGCYVEVSNKLSKNHWYIDLQLIYTSLLNKQFLKLKYLSDDGYVGKIFNGSGACIYFKTVSEISAFINAYDLQYNSRDGEFHLYKPSFEIEALTFS